MLDSQWIACQTYTWEMLGSDWVGTPDDIIAAVARAGYAGVEFSSNMIGGYLQQPDRLARTLSQHRLALAAFAYATTGFTDAARYDVDLAGADAALRFCREMGVLLCLGGAAASSRHHYQEDMVQATRFYRAVADRGAKLGVTVCVHPHSHHGSLLESADEYDALLSATADSGLMFNPDAGHIVRGGQSLMECFRKHRARIAHVHIKDVDPAGAWQPLGQGTIGWKALFDFLATTTFKGWIVAEEESAQAHADPAAAIAGNRAYLASLGL